MQKLKHKPLTKIEVEWKRGRFSPLSIFKYCETTNQVFFSGEDYFGFGMVDILTGKFKTFHHGIESLHELRFNLETRQVDISGEGRGESFKSICNFQTGGFDFDCFNEEIWWGCNTLVQYYRNKTNLIEPYLQNQERNNKNTQISSSSRYKRGYIESLNFNEWNEFRELDIIEFLRIDYQNLKNYLLVWRNNKHVMVNVIDLQESDFASNRFNLHLLMSDLLLQKQKIFLRPYFDCKGGHDFSEKIISVNLKKSNRVRFIPKKNCQYGSNFLKLLRNENYLCCYSALGDSFEIYNSNSYKLIKSNIEFDCVFDYSIYCLSDQIQFFGNKAIANVGSSRISLISQNHPFPKLVLLEYTDQNVLGIVAVTNFDSVAVLKAIKEYQYLLEIYDISKVFQKSKRRRKRRNSKQQKKKVTEK